MKTNGNTDQRGAHRVQIECVMVVYDIKNVTL